MMSEKTGNISNLHLKDKDRLFGLNILHIFARLGGLRTYKKWSIFYTPFQVFLFVALFSHTYLQLRYSLEHSNDLEEFIIGIIILLTWTKGIMKFLIMTGYRNILDQIYDSFEICYRIYGLHCKEEKRKIFRDLNKYMRSFSYSYILLLYITGCSWVFQIFFRSLTEESRLMSKIEIPDFKWTFHVDSYFPFVIRSKFVFWMCVIFHWYNYFFMVFILGSGDLTYVLLIKYLHGHFMILNMEIRRSRQCSKHKMKYILNNCIEYHNELFRITKKIERIVGMDILFYSLAFTVLVSFSGYLLMTTHEYLNAAIIKIYLSVLWFNIQLYMFIKVADDLHIEMLNVSRSAYDSTWEEADIISKLVIKMIILRGQRSRPMKGTRFIEMTNETFSKLMNSAFSYFAILRNFGEEGEK